MENVFNMELFNIFFPDRGGGALYWEIRNTMKTITYFSFFIFRGRGVDKCSQIHERSKNLGFHESLLFSKKSGQNLRNF